MYYPYRVQHTPLWCTTLWGRKSPFLKIGGRYHRGLYTFCIPPPGVLRSNSLSHHPPWGRESRAILRYVHHQNKNKKTHHRHPHTPAENTPHSVNTRPLFVLEAVRTYCRQTTRCRPTPSTYSYPVSITRPAAKAYLVTLSPGVTFA